jgi:hypothetical protein
LVLWAAGCEQVETRIPGTLQLTTPRESDSLREADDGVVSYQNADSELIKEELTLTREELCTLCSG